MQHGKHDSGCGIVCNRRNKHVKSLHKNCAASSCEDGAYTEVSWLGSLQYSSDFVNAV